MRPTEPAPASTQSCLARMVAVARCCGSMQAREVASLVALSSSSAFSRIPVILRLCQSIRPKDLQLRLLLLVVIRKNAVQPDHREQQDQRNNRKRQFVNQQPVV